MARGEGVGGEGIGGGCVSSAAAKEAKEVTPSRWAAARAAVGGLVELHAPCRTNATPPPPPPGVGGGEGRGKASPSPPVKIMINQLNGSARSDFRKSAHFAAQLTLQLSSLSSFDRTVCTNMNGNVPQKSIARRSCCNAIVET